MKIFSDARWTQTIFSLAGELARFGTIMVVVMMGFAMSFFALFRHSCTVDAFRTYTETSISLLRAMLGETHLFDEFTIDVGCCDDAVLPSDELHCEDFLMECCHNVGDEHFNGLIGKALMVAYLTVMGIILLNLLIAVLSEAYVDVKENIDTESKVSTALVIQHYVQTVEDDMMPSPLNLVQYAVALLAMVLGCCTRRKGYFRVTEHYTGLALFWLVGGLFAVSAGSILWFVSWLNGIVAFFSRQRSGTGGSRVPAITQMAVLLCGIAMPLFLLYKWLWASTWGALFRHLRGVWSGTTVAGYSEIESSLQDDDGIVGKGLKLGPGGLTVQQLREYLANPMDDPMVQRDEETRETTVEHIKLLRDRLEKIIGRRVDELDATNETRFRNLHAGVHKQVRKVVDDRVCWLSHKVDALDVKLGEILRRLENPEA